MIRKLLDRLNPTRQLPKPMRRYLALPGRLFLAWLLVSAVLVQAAIHGAATAPADEPVAQAEAPADESESESADPPAVLPPTEAPAVLALAGNLDAQLPAGGEIAVSGSTAFTLTRSGDQVILAGPGLPTLQLAGDGEELRVRTPEGATVYRLKVKAADQGKIYDAAGSYLYRLKCEAEDGEETCKLYDAAGHKLNRVKLKGDSFNVYGAGSERLYKGKNKSGAWQVRDEADHSVLTIRGVGSLREAALLAMPVEPAVRVLIWRHGGR
jgi:hypothetical protein